MSGELPILNTYLHNEPVFEADVVDAVADAFDKDRPQHEARRWEYALALTAIGAWKIATGLAPATSTPVADVGGAGSPFWRMVGERVHVIDPDGDGVQGRTLAEYLGLGHDARLFPIVTCLSVIEHVPPADLPAFLYHLTCLTQPGGLLVLTCDTCGCGGSTFHEPTADPHHFHWMRQQIITRPLLFAIAQQLAAHGFEYFGGIDYPIARARTPQVYDYTFASIVMQKRSR